MPKPKRRNDATASMKKLARFFSQEIESREWGKDEFDKLIRESKAHREKFDDRDREMSRLVLSALDRVTSAQIAADAILQLLDHAANPIAARVILDVLAALREQSHRAISDAFAAVRAIERSPMRYDRRIRRLPFPKAASVLAAFQPEPSHLVALLAGRLTPVERALRETMMACWFVERAIETVDGLVTNRRTVDPAAVTDLARFLMNAASFARDVITLRVATAIEATAKRRGRRCRA